MEQMIHACKTKVLTDFVDHSYSWKEIKCLFVLFHLILMSETNIIGCMLFHKTSCPIIYLASGLTLIHQVANASL